jgi:Transcription factor WhiB
VRTPSDDPFTDAACREYDAEMFFLQDERCKLASLRRKVREATTEAMQLRCYERVQAHLLTCPLCQARTICASCPLTGPDGPCATRARKWGEQYGVWGGLTTGELRALDGGDTLPRAQVDISDLVMIFRETRRAHGVAQLTRSA